ncbi:MAG: molecular chaperone DnaJ [Gemmataceae bacterium]|nr:molecular chaperone DnaJ [Gemmataceae bacterium]
MAKRDYYEVLSVTRTSTEVEITKAYRKLAMQHHPDRNAGDAEAEVRFKEVTEAYEILRDPQKRGVYDRHGHAGLAGMNGGGSGAGGLHDLFDDLLGSFFGGGGGRRNRGGPRPGRDIQAVLDIDLVEAATGVKKTQTVPREELCRDCGGGGARPGTKPAACRRCGGQGVVVLNQGFLSVQQTCRACDGKGQVITDPCGPCRGRGRVEARRTLEVEIPAGVDTGNRIRYAGEGDAGDPGAPRGDLEFVIRVREHKFFHRDGHNLLCAWPVSFARAALGGPVEITTLTGQKVVHDLPRGTQTDEVIRLAGHGMPNPRGGRKGDLLVQVVVQTPTQLTAEQEQLFRRLAELENTPVPGPKKGLFGKLKDMIAGEDPAGERGA